jgi:hypothetical protein
MGSGHPMERAMSRTDDPNPPEPAGDDDAREEVDEMDDRVFGGAAEERRQDAERPAAPDSDGPDPEAGDPMAGEAPSG